MVRIAAQSVNQPPLTFRRVAHTVQCVMRGDAIARLCQREFIGPLARFESSSLPGLSGETVWPPAARTYILCRMNPKQRAAESAMEFVQSGMVLGLGTGSTADQFLQALGRAIKEGRVRDIRGVPTSRQSERRAEHLGIPLATLAECPRPDVTIDGADEIDPALDLIKGLGGALLREKIVAQNSSRLVIIADAGKTVPVLGTRSPLPVEVAPFAHEIQATFLATLGAAPTLRRTTDGAIFVTDNGNYIYDCRFPAGIPDTVQMELKLKRRAGIVETGLFLKMASVVLVADEETVHRRERAAP